MIGRHVWFFTLNRNKHCLYMEAYSCMLKYYIDMIGKLYCDIYFGDIVGNIVYNL